MAANLVRLVQAVEELRSQTHRGSRSPSRAMGFLVRYRSLSSRATEEGRAVDRHEQYQNAQTGRVQRLRLRVLSGVPSHADASVNTCISWNLRNRSLQIQHQGRPARSGASSVGRAEREKNRPPEGKVRQTSVTSHEFAEAVTDTEIGLDTSNNYANPAAWGDNNNNCGEIADICDDNSPGDTINVDGRSWVVQELWSNEDAKCESVGTINLPYKFSNPVTVSAGTSFNFTLTAQNPSGGTNTGYLGTVHFTSSDGSATLPADYTFTSTDKGVKVFSATLVTSPTQTITATDTSNTALTANTTFTVNQTQVAVPNVVGATQLAATNSITGAGLTVGTVTTASSGTVAKGNVISENPTAGTQVNSGSSVNLVISSGPAQYVLTTTASPSNGGTVSPSSGTSYNQGTAVPITATAATGYAFTGWTSSPDSVANASSSSTTITMNSVGLRSRRGDAGRACGSLPGERGLGEDVERENLVDSHRINEVP
jgi:hypothetical protein